MRFVIEFSETDDSQNIGRKITNQIVKMSEKKKNCIQFLLLTMTHQKPILTTWKEKQNLKIWENIDCKLIDIVASIGFYLVFIYILNREEKNFAKKNFINVRKPNLGK